MPPTLIAITDRGVASAATTLERFAELGRLARPESVVFQLRDVALPARERLAFGRALLGIARETGQRLVINDRVDLAVLLGADGVHLGESAVSTGDARRLLGARALVTRACHDPSSAATLDADAVLLAPILQSTKALPTLGLEGLRRARASIGAQPEGPALIALGGVGIGDIQACRDAGADGVAMIRGVLRDTKLPELVRAAGISR
ncbi:MAG TPA: thiamine phosphate synthase [Polyangiaceae bacterium]